MQSYPLGKTNFATSVTTASIAARASFLGARVFTASVAMNFSGSVGPSGSGYTKAGSIGPTGPTGPQGPKGLGVYLLSSSRASCCNRFDSFIGWYGTTDSTGFGQCDTNKYAYSIGAFIYSTGSGATLANGYKIHANSGCSSPITSYNAIIDGSGKYYQVNSSGIITNASGVCTS